MILAKEIQKLKILFYSFYADFFILILVGRAFKDDINIIDEHSALGVQINSLLILLAIAAIPLSLRWFNLRRTKILNADISREEKWLKYFKGMVIRMAVIGLTMILCVSFHYLMNSLSLMYIAFITAVAYYFTRPDAKQIEADFSDDEPMEE